VPVTPFHFGIGALAKGAFPARVSFLTFVASQIVIDCETGYYLFVAREWPLHRWAHTFLLGSLIGVAVGSLTSGVAQAALAAKWSLPFSSDWGFAQCVWGGLLGGLTHPLLDGLMHTDIEPLRPFARGNPFLGLIGLDLLHLLCVACGVVGLGLGMARALASQRASDGTRL